MARRIIAALAALILAAVGVFLVINYANNADERAMGDQETVDVLVATETIARGDSDDLATRLEVRQIPRTYVADGALESVEDVEGLVAANNLTAGQQVLASSFVTQEELRRSGDYVVPEEAQGLHQLTINLPNPQALGGSIAPGDTVGLFATFELEPPTGWVIGPNGDLVWDPDAAQSNDSGSDDSEGGGDSGGSGGSESITFTDLVLDKVLVVRVEGGYLATPTETEEGGEAQDTIHVTIALEAQDAARVIQTMQTGTVWLTLSPDAADEADIDAVVPAAPSLVTGVIE
ncbi:Flp pilus assembly protein CpaB [Ornithinimicrobium cryptoxanthini]|uniref:SAF domain-containing protein n=1 Tax=Ornithinimicrobium cryptoxanthini TaxID=2934161 RepID=A0ABY4YMH2_9MICO|nr:SAF domain-containing protein [Ornithinimicrobium cryptoxanthini]USQ77465.1 SAF domain-containing protein [Ornithinimicrobium cryptoxanthini]